LFVIKAANQLLAGFPFTFVWPVSAQNTVEDHELKVSDMNLGFLTFCVVFAAVQAADFRMLEMVNCSSLDEKTLSIDVCEVKDLSVNVSAYVHRSVNNIKVGQSKSNSQFFPFSIFNPEISGSSHFIEICRSRTKANFQNASHRLVPVHVHQQTGEWNNEAGRRHINNKNA
jgi:hypothetical protein